MTPRPSLFRKEHDVEPMAECATFDACALLHRHGALAYNSAPVLGGNIDFTAALESVFAIRRAAGPREAPR